MKFASPPLALALAAFASHIGSGSAVSAGSMAMTNESIDSKIVERNEVSGDIYGVYAGSF